MDGNFHGYQDPYYHNNYNHHHYAGGYSYDQNDVNNNHRFNHQYHQASGQHYQQPYDQYYGHQNSNGEQSGPFPGGGFRSNGGGRKRGFQSGPGVSPDPRDGGNISKLYVAPIPRTATEEDIRSVFGEYGHVLEVIFPRDKRTGERGGYCFVKYKTLEESDRAIAGLQNHYTFPGEAGPVKVRYADGERDRLGQVPDKLYIGGLSKQTTKMEIHEVFSAYGFVEDIYVVRDEMKQSRGCAFVQFSRREMALAAIKALNGIFTMRGCEQPLTVKFADPKKPRVGEIRSNHAFGGPLCPLISQESVVRPTPNASFPMKQVALNSHPQSVPQWTNQETVASNVTRQVDPSTHLLHYQQQSSQSSHPEASDIREEIHPVDPSPQSLGLQQKSEVAGLEAKSDAEEIASTSTAAPQNQSTMSSLECDWSEHTCPDGHKYFYNCVTCESTWVKPEEFSKFEKQLHGLQQLQDSAKQSPSTSPGSSGPQAAQSKEGQPPNHPFQDKFGDQQSSLSTKDCNNIQVPSETSLAVGATCA